MYRIQLTPNSYRELSGFEYFNLADKHYYYKENSKTTQFVKVVRKGSQWTANHDGVHDAIVLPLAKALEARKGQVREGAPRAGEWSSIWLFFPVVLVRNRLLAYAPNSSPSLFNRGRITYLRSLESESLKGDYMIDFVRYANLSTYIEHEVLSFAKAVSELAATKARSVRGE